MINVIKRSLITSKKKSFSVPGKLQKLLSLCSLVLMFTLSSQSNAATLEEGIQQLMDTWAHVNFELKSDEQEAAFVKLIEQADAVTTQFPQQAGAWTWSGIIKSSYAGASGGLGALSFAKAAKKDFEKSIKLDPNALAGSAYTSLGVLYHKVPGWPIAFGDDDDAEKLLKQGLENNADGKIANFFYGEFLYDDRKYEQAKKHLLVAKKAPLRANSLVADQYRQVEIEALLAKVEKKLAKKSKRK